ncbi:hypothetical protein BJX62DRAFT_215501 [Aspergillus germanicus]
MVLLSICSWALRLFVLPASSASAAKFVEAPSLCCYTFTRDKERLKQLKTQQEMKQLCTLSSSRMAIAVDQHRLPRTEA